MTCGVPAHSTPGLQPGWGWGMPTMQGPGSLRVGLVPPTCAAPCAGGTSSAPTGCAAPAGAPPPWQAPAGWGQKGRKGPAPEPHNTTPTRGFWGKLANGHAHTSGSNPQTPSGYLTHFQCVRIQTASQHHPRFVECTPNTRVTWVTPCKAALHDPPWREGNPCHPDKCTWGALREAL